MESCILKNAALIMKKFTNMIVVRAPRRTMKEGRDFLPMQRHSATQWWWTLTMQRWHRKQWMEPVGLRRRQYVHQVQVTASRGGATRASSFLTSHGLLAMSRTIITAPTLPARNMKHCRGKGYASHPSTSTPTNGRVITTTPARTTHPVIRATTSPLLCPHATFSTTTPTPLSSSVVFTISRSLGDGRVINISTVEAPQHHNLLPSRRRDVSAGTTHGSNDIPATAGPLVHLSYHHFKTNTQTLKTKSALPQTPNTTAPGNKLGSKTPSLLCPQHSIDLYIQRIFHLRLQL
ncbi:hypothetical protein E2C01_015197 [Portunus trituberculatus]|uniref:Uncharacterized protein n=1 Tax=Portunus trituberculatus TaxID=210409 RepID=A0A5B7DM23_PORTR|nr:hypothetical protein [Portunus trituberculatus]